MQAVGAIYQKGGCMSKRDSAVAVKITVRSQTGKSLSTPNPRRPAAVCAVCARPAQKSRSADTPSPRRLYASAPFGSCDSRTSRM